MIKLPEAHNKNTKFIITLHGTQKITLEFKKYKNKETGNIVEGVFIKWFSKGYKFIPNVGIPLIFLTKRHFKLQFEELKNDK